MPTPDLLDSNKEHTLVLVKPDGYPSRADAQEDIRRGHCYIVADDDGPLGVFSYAPGPDPTYARMNARA